MKRHHLSVAMPVVLVVIVVVPLLYFKLTEVQRMTKTTEALLTRSLSQPVAVEDLTQLQFRVEKLANRTNNSDTKQAMLRQEKKLQFADDVNRLRGKLSKISDCSDAPQPVKVYSQTLILYELVKSNALSKNYPPKLNESIKTLKSDYACLKYLDKLYADRNYYHVKAGVTDTDIVKASVALSKTTKTTKVTEFVRTRLCQVHQQIHAKVSPSAAS